MLNRRWIVLACLLVLGCGEPDGADTPARTYEGGEAVCDEGQRAPSAAVFPDVQTIGSAANVIARGGDYLWIVESGENTVSRFHPASGVYDAYFVDVGGTSDSKNPYDIHVDEEKRLAYITNWVADTLTVASTDSGEVVAEIGSGSDAPPFDAPQGVTATDDYIYVTNTHYRSRGTFDPGSVTVLDRHTREVVARIPTSKKNPQFAETITTPDGLRIAIVSSGAIDSSGLALSAGAVELWTETADPAAPDREIFVLETTEDARVGAPGRPVITPDGTRLYMSSATAPVLFSLDLEEKQWVHDAANPLVVYESDDKALDAAAIDERGILYVTAFNEDALYLVDTACDEVLAGPIELGTTDSFLEGPQDVRVVETPQGTVAYFITGLSNVLGRVELGF